MTQTTRRTSHPMSVAFRGARPVADRSSKERPFAVRHSTHMAPSLHSPVPGCAAMPETALPFRSRPTISVACAVAHASRNASHPRGKKPMRRGLRLCLFLLACLGLLSSSGCFSMTLWRRRQPQLAKADPPLPPNASAEEILARINENAYSEFSPDGLKSYRCDDVSVRMQGVPAPMRASMVVEAPRNLRLRVANPLSGGEAVDIGSNDGRLYMLDLAKGAKLWEFEAGSPLSSSPAIAAGRIVIGAQDGRVYCFG